jgi:hypothetical protein
LQRTRNQQAIYHQKFVRAAEAGRYVSRVASAMRGKNDG